MTRPYSAHMLPKTSQLSIAALLLACSILPAQAGVEAYLSSPFTQTAATNGKPGDANYNNGYTGASTEPFDGTAGNVTSFSSNALGYTDTTVTPNVTYPSTFSVSTGTFAINANGQYGGGKQGNYLAVSATGQTTLTLSKAVSYLGLEWCAVDAGNSLTLYDQNNSPIGTFNAGTFKNLLDTHTTITAVDGVSVYNTASYKGQPTGTAANPSQNTSEYYAFVNFITTGTTRISRVVLSEAGTALFESDNWAVLSTTPPLPLGTFVDLGAVPEPSTWAFVAVAVGGLMLLQRRRRTV